jgi:hypothetical protein
MCLQVLEEELKLLEGDMIVSEAWMESPGPEREPLLKRVSLAWQSITIEAANTQVLWCMQPEEFAWVCWHFMHSTISFFFRLICNTFEGLPKISLHVSSTLCLLSTFALQYRSVR